MGCSTSTATDLQQQILPLPIDTINAYIDRVSIVMINKIKAKFQSQLSQRQYEMQELQFILLFKNCEISDNRKRNLFAYFTNNAKKNLKVNRFIEKYCILIKSDARHFSQIIHRIYCRNIQIDRMNQEDYREFQEDCYNYIKGDIIVPNEKFPLSWSQFFEYTSQKFDWEQFQNSFQIVSIDELPYKAFHQELQRFNMQFLEKGKSYFVVSAQWISLWIFFYEYEDTDIKNSNYRSNKSSQLLRKKSITVKRKLSKTRLNSSKIVSNQSVMNMQSLLPPAQINMQNIEGQYFGELKPFLNVDRDIAIINERMWSILKNTLGSSIQFERQAIDEYNVELYPVFVYFYRLDTNAVIDSKSLQIVRAKRTISYSEFKKILITKKLLKENNQSSLHLKNFQQLNFSEWNSSQSLQQIVDQNPRTIIVEIPSSQVRKFTDNYQRQNVKTDNITVGDKVMAYFSYQDKFVEAYILKANPNKKQFKVHFIGFSYNYEKWLKSTDIKPLLNQSHLQVQKNQVVYEKQVLFWGIPNIGNTCFINSILQSLVSTSIFDQFFLKAKLSQKKYPLSWDFSKIVKGLLNREKFNINEFKKIVNSKMPIFSGYDQHDAQQFLNLFLDKIDEQLQQKPNIIDQLFGGVMQSKFTCLKCKEVKTKEQKIHSISLPIPQSKYNYFVIMIFPVYSPNVRKIILRLHRNAKLNQFLSQIEQRSNINRFQFLFVESQYSVLRKYRSDLTFQANQDKKVTDLGLSSNVQIWAYEKLRNSSIEYQLKKKILNFGTKKDKIRQNQFYDFYSNEEACWGIAKIKQIKSDEVKIEFLKDNLIKQVQLKRQKNLEDQFNQLGSKVVEKIFRKIYMRRWSQSASKMVFFECQLIIGLPKWSSYQDILIFLDEYLQKIRRTSLLRASRNSSVTNSFDEISVHSNQGLHEEQLKLRSLNSSFVQDKKHPYVIHFLDPQKNYCIFCQKQLQPFHSTDQIKICCQPEQKEIPLFWASAQKSLYFVIDWVDMSEYNQNYFNRVQMDNVSISSEQKMKSEKINLWQCLDLWRKPETIEMQCQKCKHEQHLLETSIKKAPIITVFHLKEFRYTQQGHFIKLNINLEWTESINLQDYYSSSTAVQKNSMYEMYSVISHKGSTNSGHYTCMAKRKHPLQRTKVWVNFDDDYTQVINEKPETIQNAYLLFFKKVDIPSSAVVHFSI